MAIQLTKDPQFKINGEPLEGYVFMSFKLTRRLLEPNRMEFVLKKADFTLGEPEIKFDLREKLLGALVECSLTGRHRDSERDYVEDEAPKFFRGYIQHVKIERHSAKAPAYFRCVAYSPDVKMKAFPSCATCEDDNLKDIVLKKIFEFVETGTFKDGYYNDVTDFETEVEPRCTDSIPYTVQYNESAYDFLKRMAKRYGEYFYFEDGKLVFGKMHEFDPITMRTGLDIENYSYDLNLNHHKGVVLLEWDPVACIKAASGYEKREQQMWKYPYEMPHEMAKTAYDKSVEFYTNIDNSIYQFGSARIISDSQSDALSGLGDDADTDSIDFEIRRQRALLEAYFLADTVICQGRALRADLKLGSVIVLEDETNTEDNSTFIQHEPLKVIDLSYDWSVERSRTLVNTFVAIPQKSEVPPYLKRDENDGLEYGDFDIYPHCGPQSGWVVDNKDPLGMGRVRVMLQWQIIQMHANREVDVNVFQPEPEEYTNKTPWIRISRPYAGIDRGSYAVPEIGDEVLVGFEHNNAERPYVMACLFNNRDDKPVKKWTDEDAVKNNEYKAIRTRNGHTIEIRDKGEHGYIKIYDEETKSYVLTFSTDEKVIRLESKGNIELTAGNNIVMKADNDIIMEAGNDLNVETAHNITETVGQSRKSEVSYDCNMQVGHEMLTYVKGGETFARLDQEHIQVQVQTEKAMVRIDDTKGIIAKSENNISFEGQKKVGMVSHDQLILRSDMQAELSAKNTTVNGDIENVVKGGFVKIN